MSVQPGHSQPWTTCRACFPVQTEDSVELLTALPLSVAREHVAATAGERRREREERLRTALREGVLSVDDVRRITNAARDRTGAQQTPRRGTGSWVRLPGKMSKTRFDAPRSVPPILPLQGWLWVSLVMQVVMLACVIWLEFQR